MDYTDLDKIGDLSSARVSLVWAQRATLDPKVLTDLAAGTLTVSTILAYQQGQRLAISAASRPSSSLAFPAPPSKRRGKYQPIPSSTWDNPESVKGGGAGRYEEDPYDRLERAFTTIYDDNPDDLKRVQRLAHDEPIQAAQAGFQAELATEGVKGYRRQINPDACQVCFWLWKEGYVYPIDKPMWRHTGCRCVPIPTTDRIGFHELNEADQQRLDDFMEKYE